MVVVVRDGAAVRVGAAEDVPLLGADGATEGVLVGTTKLGCAEGASVGLHVGDSVGSAVGVSPNSVPLACSTSLRVMLAPVRLLKVCTKA